MDFARKQLQKFGWKEGDGLGREGNRGLKNAIKPRYKSGTAGLGFDVAKELVDDWWNRIYDDCLDRVGSDKGGTEYATKSVSVDSPLIEMRKKMCKSNFTDFSSGGVLRGNEMEVTKPESDDNRSNEKVSKKKFKLHDNSLLDACEGRTAHKGARFGLKLCGKLARLAAQEEASSFTSINKHNELEPYRKDTKEPCCKDTATTGPTKRKKKKNKRKHEENRDETEASEVHQKLEYGSHVENSPLSEDLINCKKSKKKRRKEKSSRKTVSLA